MKIVGVTKCPTGIAHTYAAAERLEKVGKKLGNDVKIETQGAQMTENSLTGKEIAEADYVIIAADVAIDGMERFGGKKILKIPIKPVLKNTEEVFASLEEKAQYWEEADKSGQSDVLLQLMNGASHMIPFVVVGGLFISLSLSFGGETTRHGIVIFSEFWGKINAIGQLAFTLMYPILAGFIAFSISGRASLAPAMIGAMVATDGEILGIGEGTGFFGCIIVGYLIGYLVKWMNSWKVSKALRPMMPIFVIPLFGVSVVSLLFIGILGKPVLFVMKTLNSLLAFLSDSPSTAIVLGLVLGAMIGVDMGGPINKVAFLFGVASISEGELQIMGIVSSAIAVAPLSMGLAAFINRKKFTEEERGTGIYTIFMGIIGISEGAIPFATSDPRHVLPAIIIGSAVSGAMAAVVGVTSAVPHGGIIVAFFGATNHILLYLLCILTGTLVSVILVLLFKKNVLERK